MSAGVVGFDVSCVRKVSAGNPNTSHQLVWETGDSITQDSPCSFSRNNLPGAE